MQSEGNGRAGTGSGEKGDGAFERRAGGSLDHRVIRRHNGKRILDAVRRHGPISRAELAQRSELSAPTVSALVDDLVDRRGLLRNVGKGESSGGRRPLMVDFNADFGFVVGIDIGSRALRSVLADLRGQVVHRHEERTPTTSREAILDATMAAVDRLFVDAGIGKDKMFAIGVGAPGMTDVTHGRVISAVNLKGWTDVPLRDLLQERFHVPVFVDNDVNMAAMGEQWAGCAKDCPNFVFIALGAGVGAGIVIDGRLYRGTRWYAGEISHLLLDHRCWDVDYGEQGYLESYAGAEAIAREWQRLRPNAPAVPSADGAAEVFEAARYGDTRAGEIVRQVAVYLGVGIANIAAVLDPALIVFGGGISHVGDQLLQPVRQVVARIVPNVPELRVSAAGDDAQVFGSLYSALQLADVRLFESL
ncbi:MAG TPA: ROK family transcriptional regulator [Vicinamibacterales bacterium]